MARFLFSLLVLLSGMAIGYGLHQPVGAVGQWREFANTEDLAHWLNRQPIDIPAFGKDSSLQNPTSCVYTALRLQERALNDGYLVGYTLPRDDHMGNIAVMGNDIWYFEKLGIQGGYIIRHVGYVGKQELP